MNSSAGVFHGLSFVHVFDEQTDLTVDPLGWPSLFRIWTRQAVGLGLQDADALICKESRDSTSASRENIGQKLIFLVVRFRRSIVT